MVPLQISVQLRKIVDKLLIDLSQNIDNDLNCRILHQKSILDRRGHVTRCVSECEAGYEEIYSWRYGHYCKKLPSGCAVQSCRKCLPGYYQLRRRYSYWSRCVDKCPIHFILENGKCEALRKGCENLNCTKCSHGYFLYPFRRSAFFSKCQSRCPIGYEKNRETNTCDKKEIKEGCVDYFCNRCIKGYYKLIDTSFRKKCVSKCPNGMGVLKGSCRRIPRGCKFANCSECVDGYFHNSRSIYFQSCGTTCPIGYFKDSKNNKCVGKGSVNFPVLIRSYDDSQLAPDVGDHEPKPLSSDVANCQVKGCVECPGSPDTCEKCQRYRAILVEDTANGTSTRCLYRCPSGYRKIYDYSKLSRVCEKITTKPTPTKPTPTKAVTVLPEGCADRNCLQCKIGFFKLVVDAVGVPPSCVKQCPLGYFSGLKDCTHVDKDDYMVNYFDYFPPVCAEARCAVCSTSPFHCDLCKQGYISMQQNGTDRISCLTECPRGFGPVERNSTAWCEKLPTPECTVKNCLQCTDHQIHSHHVGCFKCEAGFILQRNDFKDACVLKCPNGFYKGLKPGTSIDACLGCATPFCKKCVSRKKCSECYEPFDIDFKTGNCKPCPIGMVFNPKKKSCVEIQQGIKQRPLEDLISNK
eukprot:gene3090-3556_t